MEESLWLVAFYIDPNMEYPNTHTLIVTGEKDVPLMSDGYIMFFGDPDLAVAAYRASDNYEENPELSLESKSTKYYVAHSLYLINSESIDPATVILDVLNIMFDLVNATGLPMPSEYKRILYAFADHLTFDREFGSFFAQQNVSREEITNAVLWCLGAILSKTTFWTGTGE